MWTQTPDIEGLAFGMGQDQDAGEPLDALQGQCPLPIELIAPTVAARHHFGLCQTTLSTDYVVIPLLGGAANLLIGSLNSGPVSSCPARMVDSTTILPQFAHFHRQFAARTAVLLYHELTFGVFDISDAGEVGGNFHEKVGVGENLGLVSVDIVE